jgi:peptide/nickel transport system permease protein
MNMSNERGVATENVDGETVTADETVSGEYVGVKDRLLRELSTNKLALLGCLALVVMSFVAVFAPLLSPHDPQASFDLLQGIDSHSTGDFNRDGVDESVWHPLGTDSLGRDVLSRVIYGARISLLVALATVAFAFTIGTAIGLAAGFYGGWIDNLLMRYVDFQWAFPTIVLAAAIIAFIGDTGVVNVIFAIGLAFIDDFARIVRGEVLSIREKEYVKAAKAMGMSNSRIMIREILPNAVAPLIVQLTLMIPIAILQEASLSFLGIGVSTSTPTWGLMLSEGRGYIYQAWWISVWPGLAIMATVLSFNLFGDGLRDSFDIREMEVE